MKQFLMTKTVTELRSLWRDLKQSRRYEGNKSPIWLSPIDREKLVDVLFCKCAELEHQLEKLK